MGARVLVAEDEPIVRRLFARVLSTLGHQVDESDHGLEAYHRLVAEGHALAVVDLSLPRLDGLQVVVRARADGWTGQVLVASGRELSAEQAQQLAALGGGFLKKPFAPPALVQAVDSLLAASGG